MRDSDVQSYLIGDGTDQLSASEIKNLAVDAIRRNRQQTLATLITLGVLEPSRLQNHFKPFAQELAKSENRDITRLFTYPHAKNLLDRTVSDSARNLNRIKTRKRPRETSTFVSLTTEGHVGRSDDRQEHTGGLVRETLHFNKPDRREAAHSHHFPSNTHSHNLYQAFGGGGGGGGSGAASAFLAADHGPSDDVDFDRDTEIHSLPVDGGRQRRRRRISFGRNTYF
jgi:hypothetical protein